MTRSGNHDTWSELLLEFAHGELDEARSEELQGHLRSCGDCRSELVALRALLEAPDEQMSEVERTELHAALSKSSQAGSVVPLVRRTSSERPLLHRLAPALGAAALLLIGGVAVLQGGLFGGSEDTGDAGSGAGGGAALESAPNAARGEDLLGRPTWLGDLGRTTLSEVAALARSRPAVKSVRSAYGAAPAADQALQKELSLTDALAPQAPAELRDSVRSCIDEVSSQFEGRMLPAVGAQGLLDGERVLFVGFVTSSSGDRPDRLAVWAFEPRSCAPLGYQASRLAGRP
jgi:hypothetical protein